MLTGPWFYSTNIYLLSGYYLSGALQGSGDRTVKIGKKISVLPGVCIPVGNA